MRGNQKYSKKEFGYKDYYSQLEKYQVHGYQSKTKNFKKDMKKQSFSLADSLSTSTLGHKKWQEDKLFRPTAYERQREKQNINFSDKHQKQFVEHCSKLFNLKPSNSMVEDIQNEINKRDQVYDIISIKFKDQAQEQYVQKLQAYFQEYELMKKIINQFKSLSNLQTQDLNQLYYFLKTDR